MCRTPEEAFQAGWEEPCEHGSKDPGDCPECRLTPEEIARIALLMRPYVNPAETDSSTAA